MSNTGNQPTGANQLWPIYTLANYNGSGLLLELCRTHLGSHDTGASSSGYLSSGRRHMFTSGHQTRAESGKWKTNQAGQTIDGANNGPLKWWQLVANWRPLDKNYAELMATRQFYAPKISDLCAELHRLISPFLVAAGGPAPSRLLVGSRSLQPETEAVISKQSLGQVQNSMGLAGELRRSSAAEQRANLRRLSWRRQVRPAHGASENPAPRGLVAPGGQFDNHLANKARRPDPTRNGIGFPLAEWLQAEIEQRPPIRRPPERFAGLASRTQVRWSKMAARRGMYGESLVHVLIVNGTNEHLLLLALLLYLWPKLAGDVFESHKFMGLGCLHLSVAYGNERLLSYLLNGGKAINLEHSVTGSLFRAPNLLCSSSELGNRESTTTTTTTSATNKLGQLWAILSLSNRGRRDRSQQGGTTGSNAGYWCDLEQHWPTADGRNHLILFDRLSTSGHIEQGEARPSSDVRSPAPVYLGATPLAWSVSFNSRSMYEMLVGAGANQNAQDSSGNTCLHQLVINDTRSWARFLVKSGAQTNIRDHRLRLTPMLLACHLGRSELFNEFLELTAVEFWSYSMISCSGYPLAQLDSITSGQKAATTTGEHGARGSAMAAILESPISSDEQKARLLSAAVVKKLLEEKWRIYAKRLFYRELFKTLAHLMLMTLSISLRPNVDSTIQDNTHSRANETLSSDELGTMVKIEMITANGMGWLQSPTWKSINQPQTIRHLSEFSTVLLSAIQLMRFGSEWFRYGNVSLQWTYNPLLPNLVASNGLIVACALVRLANLWLDEQRANLARTEAILLIFAAPLLWSSLLFFIAAFRVTGPFVAMIRHMIVRDLRQFSLIYVVFLYSFAQCMFFVNRKEQQTKASDETRGGNFLTELLTNYLELAMDLFKMTLGVYDLQPFRHSHLARLFFLLFIYLIPILFNMLIAMMNNTYSLIISQSERACSFQWARTLFALERRLGDKERAAYLQLYSINMPDSSDRKSQPDDASDSLGREAVGEDSKRLVPALMIIRRMDYTRAERRRQVLGYWQADTRREAQQRLRWRHLLLPPGSGPEEDGARPDGAPSGLGQDGKWSSGTSSVGYAFGGCSID